MTVIQAVEHHLALLQLTLHRRLAIQAPHPALAHFSLLVLLVASSPLSQGLAWTFVTLGRLLLWQMPRALSIGAVLYGWRVLRSEFLMQEWKDFLLQWRRDKQAACVICAENRPVTPWHFLTLPCCAGTLCWNCVRRHAESVVDDARPEMLCPLSPCPRTMPDVVVSAAIRREQWTFGSLDITGSLARRKRRAYDRWSLSCGLAASCSARAEDVVHCPTNDCGHMWVLPQQLRRGKANLEPQSSWNPRSWAMCRRAGWYTAPADDSGEDLRRISCPKCRRDYCLLCSCPWNAGSMGSHDAKSCIEYRSAFPERRSSSSVQWAGARPCPGCGVRIIRSMGCNHMTCTQCGSQWCWVCLGKWSPRHYSCTSTSSINGTTMVDECALL